MDSLSAIGDPLLRDALVWVRGQPAPVTADELATAQGLHRNVARSRLERLAEAGLLLVGFERRTGRTGPGAGRPAKTYTVAPETELAEFPARNYDGLIGLLLETLPSRGRDERLQTVGSAYAATLLEPRRRRPVTGARRAGERVVQALRRHGYQASIERAGRNDAVVSTLTCPLRPLVCSNAAAAEIDRGMWRGLFAAVTGAAPETIGCELHGCLDGESACRVHIELRKA